MGWGGGGLLPASIGGFDQPSVLLPAMFAFTSQDGLYQSAKMALIIQGRIETRVSRTGSRPGDPKAGP